MKKETNYVKVTMAPHMSEFGGKRYGIGWKQGTAIIEKDSCLHQTLRTRENFKFEDVDEDGNPIGEIAQPTKPKSIDEMDLSELKEFAKSEELTGWSAMNKADLTDFLKSHIADKE